MRAVFTLFILSYLGMSKDHSVLMFHAFVILTYSSSVLGAMISDGHWGKYDTIFRFGIVFLLGYGFLTIGSNPWFGTDDSQHFFALSGFFMIGLAAGAIKPCIAPFGADQFTPEHDQGMKEIFFDVFYFSINIGAAISSIITPAIRDTQCYNIKGTEYEGNLKYNQCFSLAFFVPFLLMAAALLFFISGKNMYKMEPPAKSGIPELFKETLVPSKNADEITTKSAKYFREILKLLAPFPIFWAIFEQAGSLWTQQALEMNGFTYNGLTDKYFYVRSDQIQATNAWLIVIFLTIIISIKKQSSQKQSKEKTANKDKTGLFTPTKKIFYGYLLTGVSSILVGLIQQKIEDSGYTDLPKWNLGIMSYRIRNHIAPGCSLRYEPDNPAKIIPFGEQMLFTGEPATVPVDVVCEDPADIPNYEIYNLYEVYTQTERHPLDFTFTSSYLSKTKMIPDYLGDNKVHLHLLDDWNDPMNLNGFIEVEFLDGKKFSKPLDGDGYSNLKWEGPNFKLPIKISQNLCSGFSCPTNPLKDLSRSGSFWHNNLRVVVAKKLAENCHTVKDP